MKRLWFAAALMAGLLLLSVLGAGLVRNRTQAVVDKLESAQQAGESKDAESAALYTREAAELWEKYTPLLDALVRHEEIHGVGGALEELQVYANLRQPEEFFSRCARLLNDLRHIRESELPLLHNLL